MVFPGDVLFFEELLRYARLADAAYLPDEERSIDLGGLDRSGASMAQIATQSQGGPPARCSLEPPFWFAGFATKIDYERKGTLILTSLLEDLVYSMSGRGNPFLGPTSSPTKRVPILLQASPPRETHLSYVLKK